MKIRVHEMFVSLFLTALFALNFQPEIVHAQTTAFSYQGQLASNGVPVSGTYNLTFSLFNGASGGSAVAGPVVTNGVVVNNGLFYVRIDFGAGVWNGQTNWLQIGLETNGAASFTTLSPRQEVLPVPYAIFASSASNLLGTLPATQLSGAVPLTQLPAAVVTNNESSSVTLDNLMLNGTLNLPAVPATVNAGGELLLRADDNLNFFSGLNAGNLTTSGSGNTAVGSGALRSNTIGCLNTANGLGALDSNTNGNYNTAYGADAILLNTSGSYNTAYGCDALEDLGYSGEGGTDNIAIGYQAGFNFEGDESSNIDIGNAGVAGDSGVIRIGTPGIQYATYIAGILNLKGPLVLSAAPVNIYSGYNALMHADDSGNFFAGLYTGNPEMSASGNTACGAADLRANLTGNFNTAVGDNALPFLGYVSGGGGNGNIALGYNAGSAFIVDESSNIDIGNTGVATENGVIRIGTPGIQTAAYIAGEISGDGGGLTNLSASQFGPITLTQLPAGVVTNNETSSVTLDNLTLDGTLNLPATPVTITSGSNLLLRADNNLNFFSGPNAGNLTASGSENTGIGYFALTADTSGYRNTANGVDALYSNASGFANTACGANSLYFNTNGNNNTANGYEALYFNTSGNFNMADGEGTLYYNRSGNFNTAIGWGALQNLGSGNGSGGTNNIALGNSAGVAFSENESSNIDIGNTGVPGENGIIRIGTPGIQTATYLAGTVYANGVALSSDRNAKENFAIINARAVLDKVVALPITEWNYKTDKNAAHIGPMAQDFHAAFGLDGADDKHISVVDENGVALAAIKGLNQKLEAENAELKQENNLLARRLDKLEAQVKAELEKTQ